MPAPADWIVRDHVADRPDPRIDRAKRRDLLAIVTITLCAVISGADTWVDVERFGRAQQGYFATFLALPYGIPSHDTFGRVFAALDPAAFEPCFLGWVPTLLRRETTARVGIKAKRLMCGWDEASLLKVLTA